MTDQVLIKGTYGGRIEVRAGQTLEILNVDGQQVCDFWAFKADDIAETLSPGHTRSALRRITLRPGDTLVSCYRNPMLELVEDTCGVHDLLFPPCDPVMYVQRFGMHDHRGCRSNLAEVMADKDIPYAYLPDPVNFFQNTPVDANGDLALLPSVARPGDKVVLRALVDLLAAGSACPMEGGFNGDAHTDIRFTVGD